LVRTALIEAQLSILAKERGVSEEQVITDFLKPTLDGELTTQAEHRRCGCLSAVFSLECLERAVD